MVANGVGKFGHPLVRQYVESSLNAPCRDDHGAILPERSPTTPSFTATAWS